MCYGQYIEHLMQGTAADRLVTAFENARHIVHHLNQVERKSVLLVINMGLWYNRKEEFEEAVPKVITLTLT